MSERHAAVDDATERAWQTFGPDGVRFATVLVGPTDAHDVWVSAFLRVCRTRDWDDLDDPRRYLFKAVVNEARNLRRARERRWRRDLAALQPNATEDRRPDVDVRRAVASLSVEQRAVVLLAYWEDMTETAIAELLDLSRGTVHRNLRRARERLRKELQ
jgi:RNA polymerase sigma factor (sigma-70 family)